MARSRVPGPFAVLTVAVLLGVTGAGSGQAAAPPGPGAAGLRLTVGGKDGDWSRMVRLECEPTPHGRHPYAARACAVLDAAGGDFDALPGQPGVCRAPYEPVITTARGEFEGRAVKWRKKFANPCILRVATGPVFAF